MDNLKAVTKSVFQTLLFKMMMTTGGFIVIGIVFIIILIAIIFSNDDFGGSENRSPLSNQVLQWEEDIQKSMNEHNVDEKHLPVILAILEQESGGSVEATNGDIFQASESICGEIRCIHDPQESIDAGVAYFKTVIDRADGNVKLAVQAYNFGTGFIPYAKENNDGQWSKQIAIAFSQSQMEKVPNPENYTCKREEAEKYDACYGDILYVPTIMSFVNGYGNQEEVEQSGKLGFPVSSVTVTSEYGNRTLNGEPDFHGGMDFSCTGGVTKIYASQDGEVISTQQSSSLGNYVLIKHEEGLYTSYAHLNQKIVNKGEVKKGDPIGICGNTGNSYGAHLHFTVQNDVFNDTRKSFNPRNYLNFSALKEG